YAGAPWYKLLGARAALRAGYPYVLLLDSDAYVRDWRVTLPALFARTFADAEADRCLAVSRDVEDARVSGDSRTNTGVLLLRRHDRLDALLDDWFRVPQEHPSHAKYSSEWPYEQVTPAPVSLSGLLRPSATRSVVSF